MDSSFRREQFRAIRIAVRAIRVLLQDLERQIRSLERGQARPSCEPEKLNGAHSGRT